MESPSRTIEDRLLGTLNAEKAIKDGEKCFETGTFADSNKAMLYADEANPLDDHIVDMPKELRHKLLRGLAYLSSALIRVDPLNALGKDITMHAYDYGDLSPHRHDKRRKVSEVTLDSARIERRPHS